MSDPRRGRFDPHTLAAAGVDLESAAAPQDLNRALWTALIAALTGFLRTARKLLGLKHGEECPKCGWRY